MGGGGVSQIIGQSTGLAAIHSTCWELTHLGQKCDVSGDLGYTLEFDDLNTQDGSGNYSQWQTIGTLSGHYVCAYCGGSYRTHHGSNYVWRATHDFWICTNEGGTIYGSTTTGLEDWLLAYDAPFAHGTYRNRDMPSGGHYIMSRDYDATALPGCPTGYGGYGINYFAGGSRDPGLNYWSNTAWPDDMVNFAYDASLTELGAQMKCIAMEFVCRDMNWILGYCRSKAYTVTNGLPIRFKIWKVSPQITVSHYSLIVHGAVGQLQVITQNASALWEFYTRLDLGSMDSKYIRYDASATAIFDFAWGNSGPPFADTTIDLKLYDLAADEFTQTVSLDVSVDLQNLNGWDKRWKYGAGHYQLGIYVGNDGTAPLIDATVSAAATGMTLDAPIDNLSIDALPNGTAPGTLKTGFLLDAVFTQPNTTLTVTITYGTQVYTLTYQLTGLS